MNVLIALIDPTHVRHDLAHRWFEQERGTAWATCPITENGAVRIVGHARYPNAPSSPTIVIEVLRQLRKRAGHVFWADDISLLDGRHLSASAGNGRTRLRSEQYQRETCPTHSPRL